MIVESATVELDRHYFDYLRSARGERTTHAEVVMILPRPGRRVLTLRKSFYPEGTYNLPSGGIEPGETPELAFVREVAEETGLDAGLERQIVRLERRCTFGDQVLDFVSHFCLGTETSEEARPADPDECISDYRDASAADLHAFAEHLRGLRGRWAGFGRFRAAAMEFAAGWLEGRL